MATKISKSKFLNLRVSPKVHKAFSVKASKFGGTSEVLRELVDAFIEDRVTVKPNPEKRSLYHVS
jgi:predicted HicB family RNase H-like nuclease